jgi:hypothetical protein
LPPPILSAVDWPDECGSLSLVRAKEYNFHRFYQLVVDHASQLAKIESEFHVVSVISCFGSQ